MLGVNRKEAIENKNVRYNGKECAEGHGTERFTKNGTCCSCAVLSSGIWGKKKWESNKETRSQLKQIRIDHKQTKEYQIWDKIRKMVYDAKGRAKKKNLPFNISPDNITIPSHCPILHIPLIFNTSGDNSPNSPSLDRIIPSKGYVEGNIIVISRRANELKRNATIKEMLLLADFYKQYA